MHVREKITLEIPGCGGLFAHYRILDFRETRAVGEEVLASGIKREIDKELYLAAHHLLAACVGTEARIDGETHDLGCTLGSELTEYLGLGECENDRQALFMIFRREMDVMNQFTELQQEKTYADQEADDTLLGESEAAGT